MCRPTVGGRYCRADPWNGYPYQLLTDVLLLTRNPASGKSFVSIRLVRACRTSRCSSRESLKRNAFMISRALRRTPQELYARACQPCGRLVLVYDYELQRMRILGPYSSVEHRIDFQQLTFNCRRCR
uniref:Uncharacterized protein n=1 Tax=Toxoplasma gondii (strain ATCC 50861 / VEG) TaxID=432359 RepID=A0A0F7V0C7_TOXGV|nr:TPA: hypothetical protein BN1205_081910 [Toxoplasma gondii VEG]